MRVLVTGASGFIGRSLIRRLLANDHKPILLIEGSAAVKPILPVQLERFSQDVVAYSGDLRDRELITNLVHESKPDAIIHLAAVGVTDPFLDYRTAIEQNVIGTVNLVHAAFAAGGSGHTSNQMIVARTPGEASNMNVYAASKAAAWAFCSMYTQTKKWPIAGAVIFQAYGPDQAEHTLIPAAMKAALAGEGFPMTSGAQRRDWIYVDDVASGLTAAMESDLDPGASVDIGTGKATSVLEMVEKIYRLANRGGKPVSGALPDRPGEASKQVANVTLTEQLIGWQPATSIDSGLARVMGSFASTE